MKPTGAFSLAVLALALSLQRMAADVAPVPVTPGASREAVELLQYLSAISGKQTRAGQHAAPLVGTTQLGRVFKLTRHYRMSARKPGRLRPG
jgi:hypothetical protein